MIHDLRELGEHKGPAGMDGGDRDAGHVDEVPFYVRTANVGFSTSSLKILVVDRS